MKKISLTSFIFILMMCSLFSQGVRRQLYSDEGFVIVSPVEGKWANKQSLVLEVPETYEVFYSFTGSHPMESGFAYDGPVMIEAEGAVSIKIALVFPDGNAAVYTVDYTVDSSDADLDNLLSLNLRQPVVTYKTGEHITIPAGFSYRLGSAASFLPGDKILSLQGGTFPHRYLPCEIVDGRKAWRFVLSPEGIPASLPLCQGSEESDAENIVQESHFSTEEQQQVESQQDLSLNNFTAGERVQFYYAPTPKTQPVQETEPSNSSLEEGLAGDVVPEILQEEVPQVDISEPPFQITDWVLLTFTRDKLIYSIDNSDWQMTEGSVVIDRSVAHTISWQSVAYEKENPIYSFYLPPKPSMEYHFEGKESVLVALGPDFTFVPEGQTMEPVSSILIDAFYGEELRSDFSIHVYYDNLYQGTEKISVLVDKCPPVAPVIHPSSDSFYNRENVSLHIGKVEEGEIFYWLEMIVPENDGVMPTVINHEFDAERMQEQFQSYNGEPLLLEAHSDHGHLFQVGAFTQDRQGNASPITWFSTLIDPTNYYVASGAGVSQDKTASDPLAQEEQLAGTLSHPFSSLAEAVQATAHLDFVRLHIIDTVPVAETITINSRYEIYGTTPCSGLIFSKGAHLHIESGDVKIKNCILELQDSVSDSPVAGYEKKHPLLSVAQGKLFLEDCEIFGDYVSNGTLLSVIDSALSIINSGITLRSGEYGALVSSFKSTITVEGGQYTVIAPTAVVFSLSGGEFNLSNAQCKVYGNLGRVAELSGVGYTLTNNTFYGIFENKNLSTAQLVPVWSDGRSRLLQESGNVVSGFPGS